MSDEANASQPMQANLNFDVTGDTLDELLSFVDFECRRIYGDRKYTINAIQIQRAVAGSRFDLWANVFTSLT